MGRRLIALLVSGCAGCGLLLDLGPDPEGEKHDGGAQRDASTLDAARADARGRLDAARADGTPASDGGAVDTSSVADAKALDAGVVGSPTCAEALAAATELGPGMTGMTPTCGGPDLVDFECLGIEDVPEAYYFVDPTTDVTVTLSSGSGEDAFTFSRIDPTDCTVLDCAHTELSVPMGDRAYFAVEHFGGGCGALYSIGAMSGT